MLSNEQVNIPFSRKRLTILILIGLLGLAVGIASFLLPMQFSADYKMLIFLIWGQITYRLSSKPKWVNFLLLFLPLIMVSILIQYSWLAANYLIILFAILGLIIELRIAKKKNKVQLLLCVLVLIISLLVSFLPENNGHIFFGYAVKGGAIFIIFICINKIVYWLNFFQKQSSILALNKDGIIYSMQSFLGKAKISIPWSEVEYLQPRNLSPTFAIGVHLKELQAFINKQTNWFTRMYMKITFLEMDSPIYIYTYVFNMKTEDLNTLLNEYLADYQLDT